MKQESGRISPFNIVRKIGTIINACLVATLLLYSCSDPDEMLPIDENDPQGDVKVLPTDEGGVHHAHVLNNENIYGHYLYLPEGYEDEGPDYPLLVFLHGGGEKGNSADSASHLERILLHGPPKHIEAGRWEPPFPTIVVSPQCHEPGWDVDKLHAFIEMIVDEYAVNKKRIYLTGLSLGAHGVYNYVSTYGDDSFAAAVVPIAGYGDPNTGAAYANTAVWAFHNLEDNRVSVNSSIKMVQKINENNPREEARVTVFPAKGHNAWNKPYAGTGMGTESADYDPYTESIYEWFFRFSKSDNNQLVRQDE